MRTKTCRGHGVRNSRTFNVFLQKSIVHAALHALRPNHTVERYYATKYETSMKPLANPKADKRADLEMRSAAPTFLVADVANTARWYADHLAFQIAGTFPDTEPYAYASLQRDGVEIMLLGLADYRKPDLTARRPEGLWDAYVRMRGVHAFYQSLSGQAFIKMPLKQQSYGDWEFEVQDPNGYVLVFSELIE